MEKRLRASGAAVRPQVVFVSVDAKRDTPAQLAKYVPYFDPEFLGVTAADQPAIEALARKLGVAVSRPRRSPTAATRSIIPARSSWSIPRGKLAAILTGPFTAGALQSDFQRIAADRG